MKDISYLQSDEQRVLLEHVAHNPRYTLMVLLMLDCGLRVSEVTSFKLQYIDFQKNQIRVPALKKRSKHPIYKSIPLTERLREAFSNYVVSLENTDPQAWLFPTNSKSGHTSRTIVWRMIKKYSASDSHPHMLRHTFGTELADAGNDIFTIKELMGHARTQTSEIYIHAKQDKKKLAIQSIQKRSLKRRLKSLFVKKKDIFLPIDAKRIKGTHVGRKTEMQRINDLYHKCINVIVFGPQGVGKSHLLKRIYGDKLLKLDDFRSVKQTLGSLLLKLYDGDKEKIIKLLIKQTDINKVVTRESIAQLIELLISSTSPQEYTIVIDDLTHVTTQGVTALEKLGKHFHIIAAARKLKITQGSFLTNFERIDLKSLGRKEAYNLITALSKPLKSRIKDYEAFKNHIYEQSAGNPQFIIELNHRLSKESNITRDMLSTIHHTSALRDIDISIPVVILLSSLMVLRYLGNEFDHDEDAFRLIGGAFLIFALYGRTIFAYGKRKFV